MPTPGFVQALRRAADVWAARSDFGGIVVERLDEFDADRRVFAYSIVNDDCPLPVSGYCARVRITDKGDGTCNYLHLATVQVEADLLPVPPAPRVSRRVAPR